MELHHIVKGNDNIENAIPLCFECHSEVGHYNVKHPKGRKFTSVELKRHKKQWLEVCEKHSEIFISAPLVRDIGSLEGMLLEFEFNIEVAKRAEGAFPQQRIGCPLRTRQYERAQEEGTYLILPSDLRKQIIELYVSIGKANTSLEEIKLARDRNAYNKAIRDHFEILRNLKGPLQDAQKGLEGFLKRK